MSRLFKSAIAALALASAVAPAALAQVGTETNSVRVAYGDLNLSSKAGAQAVLRRMKAATAKVCGSRPSPKLIEALQRHETCTQDAMSRAVAEINSPLVTAMFTGEAGEKTATR